MRHLLTCSTLLGLVLLGAGCLGDSAATPSDAQDTSFNEDVPTVDSVAGPVDTMTVVGCTPSCADPGGSCVDGACACLPGYSGETCATLDPCFGDPCVHGSCSASGGSFVCACEEGWTGQTCETSDGPRVVVQISALGQPAIADAVWDLEVSSGGDVVWQQRLTSSGYGDAGGSASFAGACVPGTDTVRLWLVGAYSDTVSADAAGGFNDAVAATSDPAYMNPTWSDVDDDGVRSAADVSVPLELTFDCLDGADVFVQFDVVLLKPAQQGFFDIAVDIAGVFCSAKFDCCADDDGDGVCSGDETIRLLYDADSLRGPTVVLAFACTSGGEVTPELLLDDIAVDCSDDGQPFAADLTFRPTGGHGNLCTAGADGMSTCSALSETAGVDADSYFFQYALYPGTESLSTGDKVYWNLAFGVKPETIGGCRLRTRGTAIDAHGPLADQGGQLSPGYPYIDFDVPLGTCASEDLAFSPDASDVHMVVPDASDPGPTFAHHMSVGTEPETY